jgi:hypothetical protein
MFNLLVFFIHEELIVHIILIIRVVVLVLEMIVLVLLILIERVPLVMASIEMFVKHISLNLNIKIRLNKLSVKFINS